MLAAQLRRRGLAAAGRSTRCLSSTPPFSANELRLLQQVSRLESRVHELEEQLPARVQVRLRNRRHAPATATGAAARAPA
jgi:hypothetical protein